MIFHRERTGGVVSRLVANWYHQYQLVPATCWRTWDFALGTSLGYRKGACSITGRFVVSPMDQFMELHSNDEDHGNELYRWGLLLEILGNSRDTTDQGSGLVSRKKPPSYLVQ